MALGAVSGGQDEGAERVGRRGMILDTNYFLGQGDGVNGFRPAKPRILWASPLTVWFWVGLHVAVAVH
jgi:hypothetical protein